MSNTELEKYLKIYDEILETMVEMHNNHVTYKFRRGKETVRLVRKSAKKLHLLFKDLQRTAQATYREHRLNTLERLAQEKEERAYRKANPLKRGRKKKIRSQI